MNQIWVNKNLWSKYQGERGSSKYFKGEFSRNPQDKYLNIASLLNLWSYKSYNTKVNKTCSHK